jgi:hypothetical protein
MYLQLGCNFWREKNYFTEHWVDGNFDSLRRNSGCPWKRFEFHCEPFFLRNNEIRAKSIRRNFFSEWNFDGNPSLQASSGQMIWARIFKRFWSPGIDSEDWIPPAYICSLADRYDNPIPPRCLAPINCLIIPAQRSILLVLGGGGGGEEDLGYGFFITCRKIAPVQVIKLLRRFSIPTQKLRTYLAHPKADAEVKNKTFLLVKFK